MAFVGQFETIVNFASIIASKMLYALSRCEDRKSSSDGLLDMEFNLSYR